MTTEIKISTRILEKLLAMTIPSDSTIEEIVGSNKNFKEEVSIVYVTGGGSSSKYRITLTKEKLM